MRICEFLCRRVTHPDTLLRCSLLLIAGLLPVTLMAAGTTPVQPERLPVTGRRSHIQPVGEMRKSRPNEGQAVLGLQLSRAPEILRRQLALSQGEGLVVGSVAVGSTAASIGIQPHDVLVRLDDQLLVLPEQLAVLLETRSLSPGQSDSQESREGSVITVLRAGQSLTLPHRKPAAGPTAAKKSAPKPQQLEALVAVPPVVPAVTKMQTVPAAPPVPPAPVTPAAPPRRPLRQPASAVRLAAASEAIAPADDDEAVLLREDEDFTIRVSQTDHARLLVLTPEGRRVFDGRIDTPERLASIPPVLRPRVDAMLRVLAPPAANSPGATLGVAPIDISQ